MKGIGMKKSSHNSPKSLDTHRVSSNLDLGLLSLKEFQILCDLRAKGEVLGRDLHSALCQEVGLISGPGFYKLMHRLEESEFVECRTEVQKMKGYAIRLNHYTITGLGIEALVKTADFYATRMNPMVADITAKRAVLSISATTHLTRNLGMVLPPG